MSAKQLYIMISNILIILIICYSSILYANNKISYSVERPYPGEKCIVTEKALDSNDVIMIVDGKRIGIKRDCVEDFLNNKDKYISQMQAHGALFDEQASSDSNSIKINSLWFWISIYLFLCLLISGLTGYIAISRGLNVYKCVMLGFLLNLVGLVIVISKSSVTNISQIPKGLQKVPTTHDPVICKKCGAELHPSADMCPGCGNKVTPKIESELTKVIE